MHWDNKVHPLGMPWKVKNSKPYHTIGNQSKPLKKLLWHYGSMLKPVIHSSLVRNWPAAKTLLFCLEESICMIPKNNWEWLRQQSLPIGMRSHALKSQELKTIPGWAVNQNKNLDSRVRSLMNWDKEVRSLSHFHSKWMGYRFQIEPDYGKTNVRRQYVYGGAAAAARRRRGGGGIPWMVVTGADEKFFGIPHLSHARRKKFNGPGRLLFKPETFSFSPLIRWYDW